MLAVRLIPLIFLLLAEISPCQDLFSKRFDEIGSEPHFTRLVDGSFVIAASRRVSGDVWELVVLRIDSHGELKWKKAFRSSGFAGSTIAAISPTKDGGFIITGVYGFNDADLLVMKMARNGRLVWQKTYGSTSSIEFGIGITEQPDGNYLLLGSSQLRDIGIGGPLLMKLSPTGSILWKRLYEINGNFSASTLVKTSDGYFLAGYGLIMKLDRGRRVRSCRSWFSNDVPVGFSSAAVTTSGDFVVSGFVNVQTGSPVQLIILKLSPDATKIRWEKTFNTGISSGPTSLACDAKDDCTVVAVKTTNENFDPLIIKLDNAGHLLWKRTFGDSSKSYGVSILNIPSGGYALLETIPTTVEGLSDSAALSLLNSRGRFPGCGLSRSTALSSTTPAFQTNDLTYVIKDPALVAQTPAVTTSSVSVGVTEVCK